MNVPAVRAAVARWARTVDRPLPWRGERDPYRVLVSEVMLQQTQAARVVEPYLRFLDRFPTIDSLARAEGADVLRAWGSLGYNRRALNVWRTARACPDGLPSTVAELLALPGIGQYTARAVASFAFGADEAPVDANVRRIITRMVGAGVGEVQIVADVLVPRGGSRWWNQALMDLGATVCTPRSPRCGSCPLRRRCAWAAGDRPATAERRASVPFASTDRYVRGRVVAGLRSVASASVGDLCASTGLSRVRVRDAVRSLRRDGLVSTCGNLVTLGPTAPGDATRPRRARGSGAPSA